jgi:hypothetical protein
MQCVIGWDWLHFSASKIVRQYQIWSSTTTFRTAVCAMAVQPCRRLKPPARSVEHADNESLRCPNSHVSASSRPQSTKNGPSERLYVCAVRQRAAASCIHVPTSPPDAASGQLELKPLSLDFSACVDCCFGKNRRDAVCVGKVAGSGLAEAGGI